MNRFSLLLVPLMAIQIAGCPAEQKECTPNTLAVCTCDDGDTGTQVCLEDGKGFGECTCAGVCDGVDCSGHGVCQETAGLPTCACDPGYAGPACGQCDAGYQDRDQNGTCELACAGGALTCGAHGVCDDSSGAAVCACDPGYRGNACELCASGYQDEDEDGACRPDCSTAALDCAGNGVCDDSSGEPICACLEGYFGLSCDRCAAGYQDNDGDGTCLPDCLAGSVTCGAHGVCTDQAGPARCVCDAGYRGTSCEFCDLGYQDNDGDGSCSVDCSLASLNCSGNGSCGDGEGTASCVCAPGYAGDTCDVCDLGFQDLDGDGVCQPDCTTAGLDCGQHGGCATGTGQAVCVCDDGYEGVLCGSCASGYQDRDGDGVCQPDCTLAALDCGSHGLCSDVSGEVQCLCESGYVGQNCAGCDTGYLGPDAGGLCAPGCTLVAFDCGGNGFCDDSSGEAICDCDPGYQDNDVDGMCAPNCALSGVMCGLHGTCNDSGGLAVCDCDEGYDGESCALCADGYQDNDGNTICAPSCETIGLDCGGHGLCDDQDGTAECNCDFGYQDNDADGACEVTCAVAGLDCGVHGACDDGGGSAICVCDVGFGGQFCELCQVTNNGMEICDELDNDCNGAVDENEVCMGQVRCTYSTGAAINRLAYNSDRVFVESASFLRLVDHNCEELERIAVYTANNNPNIYFPVINEAQGMVYTRVGPWGIVVETRDLFDLALVTGSFGADSGIATSENGSYYFVDQRAAGNLYGTFYASDVTHTTMYSNDLSCHYNLYSPVVMGEDGTAYVNSVTNSQCGGSSFVRAIDNSGATLWTYNCSPYAHMVANNSVLISSANELISLSLGGAFQWKRTFVESTRYAIVDELGAIYVAKGADIVKLNAAGNEVWTFTAAGDISSGPVIGNNGRIYFGAMDQFVYAIDTGGALVWSTNIAGVANGAPVIAGDGTIFFSTNDGRVIGFYGSSSGLAASEWPRPLRDNHNTNSHF